MCQALHYIIPFNLYNSVNYVLLLSPFTNGETSLPRFNDLQNIYKNIYLAMCGGTQL